jgi:hypothetical protein
MSQTGAGKTSHPQMHSIGDWSPALEWIAVNLVCLPNIYKTATIEKVLLTQEIFMFRRLTQG